VRVLTLLTVLVFNRALNPPKKIVVEEKQPETEAEPTAEPAVEQTTEQPEEVKEERRRPVKPTEEVKKEDLLERPENALTLEEYLAQHKQKNQGLRAEVKTVERPAESLALNPQTRNESEQVIGITSGQVKKQKVKVKDTKVNKGESELNQVFANNLKLEDNSQRRDYKGNQTQKPKKDNFKFNANEFPEL
jgi:hypothetical protein